MRYYVKVLWPSPTRNLFRIVTLMPYEESTKRWAIEYGFMPRPKRCIRHNTRMRWQYGPLNGIFRCQGSIRDEKFDHNVAAKTNPWFERIGCSERQRIIISYCFAKGETFEHTANEAQISETIVVQI